MFTDVIVYIFPHSHTTLRIEGIMLDTILLQKIKELVKLSKCWNFWLFGCNSRGEIGFQKHQNFCVAKALMSSFILCKIYSF